MCGILVFTSDVLKGENLQMYQRAVACRGPDSYSSIKMNDITFESSVLSLRTPFLAQPLHTESYAFCYNGQIYDHPSGVNDTIVAQEYCQKKDFETFMRQEGEFAFVHYDQGELWFGRDPLGRRSLLYKHFPDGNLIVSSVTGDEDHTCFTECDGGGVIYKYTLQSKALDRIQLAIPQISVSREVGAQNRDLTANLLEVLREAVKRRLIRPLSEPNVALLFSGGLDCALLASLLDEELPDSSQIELLNVAFENRRIGSMWDTPDRLLAHRTLLELKSRSTSTNPHRFSLTEINISYEEAQKHIPVIRILMAPCHTVIDLSIAMAFYFASRPPNDRLFPRIMFSGLGADELFAGYSRHTSASQKGSESLASELEKDFNRLPHRNLGRDDRVCASWGREVRYPFLDREVVELAFEIPLAHKTDGQTTKIALREAARLRGLKAVANEQKRAIQFGAKSAKMDPGSGRSKGHHILKPTR